MSVLATQTNETSDFFYNEAFDPSLPIAISSILNYVVSVHTYSHKSRTIKGLDIKMTFNKILRSTKIKTIFRRKLYINVLSTKIKKNITKE